MLAPATLTFGLFVWFLATLAHVLLTGRVVARVRGLDRTRDDTWFDTTLVVVGSLAVVVHLVAASVGLTLWSGTIGLAIWHAALAAGGRWYLRGPRAAQGHALDVDAVASEAAGAPAGWLETAAVATLVAIAMAWVGWSSWSVAVVGTDAANYHVPVAVNLALGASPMDLPPTSHLYPMTTSTLAAWFLVATGDALLVDLTMVLPFTLLVASTGLVFRLATGASGLAWSTWFVVALFATPMLRASSLLSADLLFAAAFVAVVAQGVRLWAGPRTGPVDVLLAGLAVGLLVGSKTTGVAATVLLGTVWLFVTAITRRQRWRAFVGPATAWAGAAALAVFAGGIWLIRNWLLFGSPVAPNGLTVFGVELLAGPAFEPTTYLSVLGDVRNTSSYSLAARAAHYLREWFGPIYLPFLLVALSIPIDAFLAWRRGAGGRAATRMVIAALTLGAGLPLIWLLIGAPWTSLEWTQGHALRYALPVAVLLPTLSFIGLFPASWQWYRRDGLAAAGGALLAGGSLVLLARSQGVEGGSGPPRLTMMAVVLGAVVSIALLPAVRRGARLTLGRGVLVAVLAAAVAAPVVASRDVVARATAEGLEPAGTQGELLRAAVLDAERAAGQLCERRRFLVITRFDEPMALQSPTLDSLLFYAARDVSSAERVGALTACDYVVATRAVLGTERGEALLRTFYPSGRTKQIGDTGRFVVLTNR